MRFANLICESQSIYLEWCNNSNPIFK